MNPGWTIFSLGKPAKERPKSSLNNRMAKAYSEPYQTSTMDLFAFWESS